MKKRLLAILTENTLLKVVSLLFAISLWIYVSLGQTELERPAKVSVESRNLSKNLILTSDLPSELEIKVRGPRNIIRKIRDSELRYVIDLAEVPAGPMIFIIYDSQIEGLPQAVKVTQIIPSQIGVKLSPRENKLVDVVAVTRGVPTEGYEIVETAVEPKQIEISGAAEVIKNLDSVDTQIIDVTGRMKTFTKEVGIGLLGHHVETLQQQSVLVTVHIEEKIVSQVFEGVPIRIRNCAYLCEPSVSQLSIKLQGKPEEIEGLLKQREGLYLLLDAKGLQPTRRVKIKPTLVAPGEIRLGGISLPEVEIAVQPSPTSGKEPSAAGGNQPLAP